MEATLDGWIKRCEAREDVRVREEISALLAAPEAKELPLSVSAALERGSHATDRTLTALCLLAALDTLTGFPASPAG